MKETPGDMEIASPPRRHRYPTRWNLRRHPSLFQEAPRLEDKSKNQVLVPCKRKREESHTIYLPREIIFNILLVVPADALHGVLRYVCKQWYNIVNDPEFIRAHCQLSSAACHITQNPHNLHQVSYIEEEADRLKVTEIQIPFSARLYGSLNGLILLQDITNPEILHVMNLVTKVKLSLPPAVGLIRIKGSVGFAITSSGHYKVVHVSPNDEQVQLRVFTIGVDKAWRSIGVHGIPWGSNGHHTLLGTPYLIAGFWYWFNTNFVCFALDVNTETIYQFSKPENFFTKLNPVSFISLGASLGLTKGEEGIWRIWKLTDVKTGEWAEMARINILEMMSKVDKLFYPCTLVGVVAVMLIDGEFWFYRGVGEGHFVDIVVRYNLTNGSFVFSPIKGIMVRSLLHPHVHTLLSPKKCYPGIM